MDTILRTLDISPAGECAADADLRSRIGGIFTDNSFKLANLTINSLLVSMDELRRQGGSEAAVVLMGAPDHWKTAPLRVLWIVPADKAEDVDAITVEIVGIILGTRIAEGLPHYVTLHTATVRLRLQGEWMPSHQRSVRWAISGKFPWLVCFSTSRRWRNASSNGSRRIRSDE
jgi:hypothetical protein